MQHSDQKMFLIVDFFFNREMKIAPFKWWNQSIPLAIYLGLSYPDGYTRS
ncbi:hypothetical protein BDFB_012867 [Asbolus verrucosus]|uniref:Uncharacterized protein n=1 Tax=Asbolus verrucosus TaxID=1661398 RepID=A0A482V8D2_ASBVE|nr:hypothetical protein BDFB_012867 [Asbolus verrucosus]